MQRIVSRDDRSCFYIQTREPLPQIMQEHLLELGVNSMIQPPHTFTGQFKFSSRLVARVIAVPLFIGYVLLPNRFPGVLSNRHRQAQMAIYINKLQARLRIECSYPCLARVCTPD